MYKALLETPEERDPLEERGVDGRTGSEWILWRSALGGGGGMGMCSKFAWLRIGTGGRLL
jgi:hypothetical protein